ncbi:archemetzincin [Saccharolobus solfataricus]|uniref:Archaemetzincin n=3 Tax=Saccharolobus solfataricus TaxID=2287 RepID=AMZA_SACS2|nr:archaemetzincin family Zn-dependent metalloprotease [Saccharolobus solfataricus]Q9UX78.1 RecName: Full=Archaemetzincin [Saccharolobus solfataricus P2]AAK40989.1 Conserved hypothetical protein [Saccharolobus solfataricus P2]AKA74017.1 archemetzincin [Saccharolobus solfataricus]AKA76714.1 archemetzincin [Saccharolobus solfataricus]AKA79408.1 archemetzincin [Saccharolobus solfataricus]AZF68495.1 archemetzincin [Saccharolobus solfataricus]
MTEMKILIVTLTYIEKSIIDEIVNNLSSYGLEVDILLDSRKYLPISAFNWERLQYDAEKVLSFLKSIHDFNYDSIIFLADSDGYIDGYNFVFGLTIDNFAIIFLHRLREEFYNRKPDLDLFMKRVVKEVTHEVGHTLGLSHCNTTGCVMNFSNSVEDVDKKQAKFCKNCAHKIEKLSKYLQQK